MSTKYTVWVEDFAERHFIKRFAKKYKHLWSLTLQAIQDQYKRIDGLLGTSIAEEIICSGDWRIVKTEFRIVGTKQSRKGSGNRCILVVNQKNMTVNVLLVYHKDDLGHGHETAEWQKIVKDNYPQYRNLF